MQQFDNMGDSISVIDDIPPCNNNVLILSSRTIDESGKRDKNIENCDRNKNFFSTNSIEDWAINPRKYDLFSFLPIRSRDPKRYMLIISSIYSLQHDQNINVHLREKAMELFEVFFHRLIATFQELSQYEAIGKTMLTICLREFCDAIEIAEKEYETKTKVKALLVSVVIQRAIELHLETNPNYPLEMVMGLLRILETQPLLGGNNNLMPKLEIYDEQDLMSLTRFYIALTMAQDWQTHAKWEKFAFYVASMAVGEGIWYCPGGAAKSETLRRKQLFMIMEKVANKYEKLVKKRKVPSHDSSSPLLKTLPCDTVPQSTSTSFAHLVASSCKPTTCSDSTTVVAIKIPEIVYSDPMSILLTPSVAVDVRESIGKACEPETVTVVESPPMTELVKGDESVAHENFLSMLLNAAHTVESHVSSLHSSSLSETELGNTDKHNAILGHELELLRDASIVSANKKRKIKKPSNISRLRDSEPAGAIELGNDRFSKKILCKSLEILNSTNLNVNLD
jgi:hypothetical protein